MNFKEITAEELKKIHGGTIIGITLPNKYMEIEKFICDVSNAKLEFKEMLEIAPYDDEITIIAQVVKSKKGNLLQYNIEKYDKEVCRIGKK